MSVFLFVRRISRGTFSRPTSPSPPHGPNYSSLVSQYLSSITRPRPECPRPTFQITEIAGRLFSPKSMDFVRKPARYAQSPTSIYSSSTLALPAETNRPTSISVVAEYAKCYYELSKARLSFLVMATASAGFVLGSGELVDYNGLFWTSLGTVLTAASANTFNQVMEMRNDGLMKRTRMRPLPSSRITKLHALSWGVFAAVSGIAILLSQTNNLTAGLATANLGLYVLAYTPLKQLHIANTWIGAVVGAIPPLMGWASASGGIDFGSSILALGLYFWQMPHFMALAWLCRQDYAAGGFRMISLNDISGKRTAAVAMRNCIYLLPLGFLAVHFGATTETFAYENLALSASMLVPATRFYRSPSNESARALFRWSLIYLPALMAAMMLHRIPHHDTSSHHQHQQQQQQHLQAHARGSQFLLPSLPLLAAPSGLTLALDASEEKEGGTRREGIEDGAVLPRCVEGSSSSSRIMRADVVGIQGRGSVRPPIAFMSAAPFPFLPVPDFSSKY